MADALSAGRLEEVVRAARPRLIALLASVDGDLVAAEDAFSDAVEQALVHWSHDGVPARPEAWLLTVARNRRRDRWRSDRRLALLAAAAHPDIDPTARTPLMLKGGRRGDHQPRLVCGVWPARITGNAEGGMS